MKRLRNKKILVVINLIGLALLPAAALAQTDTVKKVNHYEFSIQQAVDYAKKNNVAVKNALLDIKIQEQTNREITAAAYPQMSGSLFYIDNTQLAPVVIEGGGIFGGTPGTYQKIASFKLDK